MKYIDNYGQAHDDITSMIRVNVMGSQPVTKLRSQLKRVKSRISPEEHYVSNSNDISTYPLGDTVNTPEEAMDIVDNFKKITIDYENGLVILEDTDGNVITKSKISETLNINKDRADMFVLMELMGPSAVSQEYRDKAVDNIINEYPYDITSIHIDKELSLFEEKKLHDIIDSAADIASRAMQYEPYLAASDKSNFFRNLFDKFYNSITSSKKASDD